MMSYSPDALALFSGGLDSILAARLLMREGIKVLCLHFTSPFFGSPGSISHWQKTYGLDIMPMDITQSFVKMLAGWPPNGIGKTLNPCLDCKILMLKEAAALMERTNAKFVATGEVKGQRPMSQRIDAMNIIARESGLFDRLVRPLCLALLPPTWPEQAGLLDRSRFPAISGRGRLGQLALAKEMGIEEIPNPGGGCRLTERENARRYWPLLKNSMETPNPEDAGRLEIDFRGIDSGRLLFHKNSHLWLRIGRNKQDNADLLALAEHGDCILRLPFPGPCAVLRGERPDDSILAEAAAILASYSPRACQSGYPVEVSVYGGGNKKTFSTRPHRSENWHLPAWPEIQAEIKAERKRRMRRDAQGKNDNSLPLPE